MKSKIFSIIIWLILVCFIAGALPASAEENRQADEIISSVIDFKLKETDSDNIQDWISGALSQKAGISSEWFVIGLRQNGDYDFSAYSSSLSEYLDKNEVNSPSSREKYALALIASGSDDGYITDTLNNSIGEQGIMSWVFGLHILNNGYKSENYTIETVIENILSLQLSDGGFALYGENGDVDTTAMVIQALAPYYSRKNAKDAIDLALAFLSKNQTENGGYKSRGVENSESIAQVLVALSSLGIDCVKDERFIKTGNNLFDAILDYRLPDGGFCHQIGGRENNMATAQAFYSSVAYLRMTKGESPLYIFEKKTAEEENTSQEISHENSSKEESEEALSNSQKQEENTKPSYKLWVSLIIGGICISVCLIMMLTKRKNKRNYLFVVIAGVVAILFVCLTNFQSADEFYGNQSSKDSGGKVTISISCHTVAGKKEHIPQDGIILASSELEISQGDTVYDILLEAASKNKIHLETNGGSQSPYVEGIGNIYEFDFGDLSGWVFFVNGEEASVSCGEYQLNDGDRIEWHYTCALGEDLK